MYKSFAAFYRHFYGLSSLVKTTLYSPLTTLYSPFTTSLLHFTTLLCTFVVLIEKDGGIRPCDVLATCTYKVLHSTWPPPGKISESQSNTRLFDKPFPVCSFSWQFALCISCLLIFGKLQTGNCQLKNGY